MTEEKQIIDLQSYEETEEQVAFIEMVAKQLTRNFMKYLSQPCSSKSYFTHAGILSEIFEWSLEFFDLYYREFENFLEATDLEEAVIAFGNGKLQHLLASQHYLDAYFIKRYKNDLQPNEYNKRLTEN